MANETKLPPVDRLKAQLLGSGLQQQNFPLYQVINQLIDALRQTIAVTDAVLGISSGGGGTGILNQSFVTVEDDSGVLPNSRIITAGDNITLEDSGGEITINANISATEVIEGLQLPLTMKQVEIEIIPNRRNGRVIIRDTFTEFQIGAPVIIAQAPDKESDMVFVQFVGEIINTHQMRVFWMAPFGAPRKMKINYLIGA